MWTGMELQGCFPSRADKALYPMTRSPVNAALQTALFHSHRIVIPFPGCADTFGSSVFMHSNKLPGF